MTTSLERPTEDLAAWADQRFRGIADREWQALSVLWWAGETFGNSFAITASMADGLLVEELREATTEAILSVMASFEKEAAR